MMYARADQWLAGVRAVLVGAGKVGSGWAVALATHGVGELVVCDPQRTDDAEAQRDLFAVPPSFRGSKVDAVAAVIRQQRPAQVVRPLAMTFEAARDTGHLEGVDVVLACPNQVATRHAIAAFAAAHSIVVVSAAVSLDGTAGEIVRWHPALGDLACPACLLPPPSAVVAHDAGLPIQTTMFAACLAFLALSDIGEHGLDAIASANVVRFDATTPTVEWLRVRRAPRCSTCTRLVLAT